MLYIYPSKPEKKNFDEHKDELVQRKEKKKKLTADEFKKTSTTDIEHEWFKLYNDFGLTSDFRQRLIKNYAVLEKQILNTADKPIADHAKTFNQIETQAGAVEKEQIEKEKIIQQFHKIKEELPKYKETVNKLTINQMKLDIQEEIVEKKWNELNTGIDQWKQKYLYPFGQILPKEPKAQSTHRTSIFHSNASHHQQSQFDTDLYNISKQQDSLFSVNQDQSVMLPQADSFPDPDSFDGLTKSKYLFPHDKLTSKEWFRELQKPLNVTVPDIVRDFEKFVKDFPVDIIPHSTEEDKQKKKPMNTDLE